MPLFSSRTKSITFRLSAEEHEALMNYCIAQRVRSVSELARESILLAVQSNRPEQQLITGDLAALGSSLREIDAALIRLSSKISKILGPPRKVAAAQSNGQLHGPSAIEARE